MNFLELIDIYGTQYQFKFFGKTQYKSRFSMILSLLTIAALIVMIIYFGDDLWYSRNPKIMTQFKIPDAAVEAFPHTNNDNFTLGWRIETEDGEPYNFDNILYPVFFFAEDANNKTSYTQLYPVKCSKVYNSSRLDPFFLTKINNKTDDWYCFDLTKDPINIVNVWKAQLKTNNVLLNLKIGYCPNLNPTEKCTPYDTLYKELVTNTKYMHVVLNMYRFDAMSHARPVSIEYISYKRPIDLYLLKRQKFSFTRVKMYLDDGVIGETWDKKSYIIHNFFMNDVDNYLPKENYLKQNYLYNIDFVFDGNLDCLRMTYMKLQDLAANVGGFLSIAFSVCSILSAFYNNFFMSFTIYNTIFDFSLPETTIKDNKDNKDNKDDLTTQHEEHLKIATNSNKETETIELKKEPSKTNGIDEKHLNKVEKGEFVIYGVNGTAGTGKAYEPELSKEDYEGFINTKKKAKKVHVNEYFNAKIKSKENNEVETEKTLRGYIEKVQKFEDKVTDFRCIANIVLELEQLKNILFDESQKNYFKLMKKLKINSLSED